MMWNASFCVPNFIMSHLGRRPIYAFAAVEVLNVTLHYFKYTQHYHDVWDFDLSWQPFLLTFLRPLVAGESAFSSHGLLSITSSSVRVSLNGANCFYTSCIDSISYLICFIKSRLTFLYILGCLLFLLLVLRSWNQIGVLHRKVIMVVLLVPVSNEWDNVVYIRKYLLNF